MKLTEFTFYKNTPLVNLQNTIHFKSNERRDEFFNTHYQKITFNHPYNFRIDRGVIKVSKRYDEMIGYNYCKFIDGFDNRTYYAFVIGCHYETDNTTRIDILIDLVMTHTNGNVLQSIGFVDVIRSHLPRLEYEQNLERIRASQDMPTINTLRYTSRNSDLFGDTYVLLYSTVDLTKDYGDEKKPKMSASSGGTYDRMTSPVDLYIIERNHFDDFTESMQKYPWIMQNITKCVLIPKKFVDKNDLKKIKTKTGFNQIFKLKSDQVSNDIPSSIQYSKAELLEMLNIKPQDEHLLRAGYATIELTDYKGQTLAIDLSKVEDLRCTFKVLLGYKNEIRLVVDGYGSRNKGQASGYYLNYSLGFVDFDEMPIMINNADLTLAKSAYSRELSNSRTISGRLGKIAGADSSISDRVFNSLSVFSDVFAGSMAGSAAKGANLFNNEYEYYREQNAQMAELALTPPTVTSQVTGNAFLVKSSDWGVHMLIATPTVNDRLRARTYYNMFGFEINERKAIDKAYNCNEFANWLQFKGNWNIPNVDVESMNALRTIFEGGVRFWHDKDIDNPMNNALLTNDIVR